MKGEPKEYKVIIQLAHLLPQYGVRYVVCSPGSRNAAILQVIDTIESLIKLIIVDERSAAFVALGLSIASKSPVALICTSGSAVLNYGPAISEAYYQGVPLIAISADRPLEWIDQDDSQTIRQYGVINNIVKESLDLDGTKKDETYLWYVNRSLNEILRAATNVNPGPVHINIHLDGKTLTNIGNNNTPIRKIQFLTPKQEISIESIKELVKKADGKKILVIAGFMLPDNNLQKAFLYITDLPNICIMAETVSNLHLDSSCYRIDNALFKMNVQEQEQMKPDIVISMGGAIISRKLKEFLRNNPPQEHWSLSNSDRIIDCFKSLTLKIECAPSFFMKKFGKGLKKKQTASTNITQYKNAWNKLRIVSKEAFINLQWSDLKALNTIFNSIPHKTNLFLSNGTVVRYHQIIPSLQPHAVYANRGVSGIEGCTSTAIGTSLIYNGFTCLVTGDMSFGYDLGGISLDLINNRFRIIVLDNGGGDIFRFIPNTKDLTIRERYLSVNRELPVKRLCQAFGLNYFYASDERSLKTSIELFWNESSLPSLFHIDTSNCEENAIILQKFLTNNL